MPKTNKKTKKGINPKSNTPENDFNKKEEKELDMDEIIGTIDGKPAKGP